MKLLLPGFLLLAAGLPLPPLEPPIPGPTPPPQPPSALFLKNGDLAAVPAGRRDLAGVLDRLLQGPTPAQAAAGLTTAYPPGTRLLGLRVRGGDVTLLLSKEALGKGDLAVRAEDMVRQAVGTVETVFPSYRSLQIRIQTPQGVRTLSELLPPPPRPALGKPGGSPPPVPAGPTFKGALSGRMIAVSPGHGLYWNSTYRKWLFQRPLIDGLREDIHNNEICMDYLIPYLENMGARVISCRERTRNPSEIVLDNDKGAPSYKETGSWSTSSWAGYKNKTYRYAISSSTETATAAWTAAVPREDDYGIYVFFRAGSNRCRKTLYRVEHTGGTTEIVVDQSRDDRRWVWLGSFHFSPAKPARVVLSNRSSDTGKAVIADAVRLGAGLGDIDRGGGPSRQPRWKECSRYWAQTAGAPASVYVRNTGSDHWDDVTTRPRYAEWRGADLYVSHHTNAGGGTGTSSYIYNGTPTPGSVTLQKLLQKQLITDIRKYWDPSWVDRGMHRANFGEVRELKTMPGVLLEVAFHDDPRKKDHAYLHDPHFRRIEARAISRGILRYFHPNAPFAPDPPGAPRAQNDGKGGIRVSWEASPGATGYLVERSPDGKGFVEAGRTTALSWSTGPLPLDTVLFFRVRAVNSTGVSFPTEVVGARRGPESKASLLMVNGFDRLDRYVKGWENTRDYLGRHGLAFASIPSREVSFDSCANEAVTLGRVKLGAYRVVDWLLGEESTKDETFSSAEQALVTAFLKGGGSLLVTGSELAWDLDHSGYAADRTFIHGMLGTAYAADDAGTYSFAGVPGSCFSGIPLSTFDDGTQGTYNVDYPDVFAPAAPGAKTCLLYGGNKTAALQWNQGTWRVITAGFPLETVTGAKTRTAMAEKAMAFLDPDPPAWADPEIPRGGKGRILVHLPTQGGKTCFLAAALSPAPGIPLPGGRILPLAPDPLFLATLGTGGGIFRGFYARLDAQGRTSASWQAPNLPELAGTDLYFAAFTYDPASPTFVGRLTNWARTRVK